MYAKTGRSSIAPEKLTRALLQVFYSIRSEQLLMEQLNYNLLLLWFASMNLDDPVWDHSTFSKNRDRLIEVHIARRLMLLVVELAREKALISEEHFSVNATLIEAWASQKSFRPKDEEPPESSGGRNPKVDLHGERRINDTHASHTDPESRLYRKSRGKEAKRSFAGHALMENRSGFVIDACASPATGTAETVSTLAMVNAVPNEHGITVGSDNGFDTADFVSGLTAAKAMPHIARNTTNRESAVPEEIAATEGYAASQRCRKRIEEVFGWGKSIGPIRKATVRGLKKVDWLFKMTMAAYNIVRLRNLAAL